jgi:hypothetical protein
VQLLGRGTNLQTSEKLAATTDFVRVARRRFMPNPLDRIRGYEAVPKLVTALETAYQLRLRQSQSAANGTAA